MIVRLYCCIFLDGYKNILPNTLYFTTTVECSIVVFGVIHEGHIDRYRGLALGRLEGVATAPDFDDIRKAMNSWIC